MMFESAQPTSLTSCGPMDLASGTHTPISSCSAGGIGSPHMYARRSKRKRAWHWTDMANPRIRGVPPHSGQSPPGSRGLPRTQRSSWLGNHHPIRTHPNRSKCSETSIHTNLPGIVYTEKTCSGPSKHRDPKKSRFLKLRSFQGVLKHRDPLYVNTFMGKNEKKRGSENAS